MEEFERISSEDKVTKPEKDAFSEMQRDIKLRQRDISEDIQQRSDIEEALADLPNERQREVIRRRFLEGETRKEVARVWGVTTSAVRQMEERALRVLKNFSRRYSYQRGFEPEEGMFDNKTRLLHLFQLLYKIKARKNPQLKEAIEGFYRSIGTSVKEEYLASLDLGTFNVLYEKIRSIMSKKQTGEADVAALNKVIGDFGQQFAEWMKLK